MANTILTPTAVTREALRILHQKLRFIPETDLQYDDQYAKTGAKIGTDLKIRTPNQYVVRKGASLSAQDTVESSVTTLTVASQYGVDLNFTSVDLTLSLDDFSASASSTRRWRSSRPTSRRRALDPLQGRLQHRHERRLGGDLQQRPLARKLLVDNLAPSASGRSTSRRRTTSTSSTR
jgi:hypothetical protein